MKCLFPRVINNPHYKGGANPFQYEDGQPLQLLVPCGKCYECLKERRLIWLFRLKQESLHSCNTYFITLSFDDKICKPRLYKEDLQLLFKRIRKKGYVFKYYAIGEYGSNFKREHYHCVLFFKKTDKYEKVDFQTCHDLINSNWKNGFITIGEANFRRLNYILHYHIRPKSCEGKKEKTFAIMSKGLGLQFITPEVLNNLKVSASNIVEDFEGRTISLPRYYRKKFDIPNKDEIAFKSREWETLHDYARKNGLSEYEYIKDLCHIDKLKREKYNNESF